jgi:hypothetical protein
MSLTEVAPLAEALAWETAVTVRVVVVLPPEPLDLVGTPPGAKYSPLVEMNPNCKLPPGVPFTDQWTAVFEVPLTAALNCCLPKLGILGVTGETTTVMFEEVPVTVIELEPDFVGSASEVAVTVTSAGF